MDRNRDTNYDPLLFLSTGWLAILATVLVVVAILAAVGSAAGVPISELIQEVSR